MSPAGRRHAPAAPRGSRPRTRPCRQSSPAQSPAPCDRAPAPCPPSPPREPTPAPPLPCHPPADAFPATNAASRSCPAPTLQAPPTSTTCCHATQPQRPGASPQSQPPIPAQGSQQSPVPTPCGPTRGLAQQAVAMSDEPAKSAGRDQGPSRTGSTGRVNTVRPPAPSVHGKPARRAQPNRCRWGRSGCAAHSFARRGVDDARAGPWPETPKGQGSREGTSSKGNRPNSINPAQARIPRITSPWMSVRR